MWTVRPAGMPMAVDFDLERFVRAQDDGGTYRAAVAELRAPALS